MSSQALIADYRRYLWSWIESHLSVGVQRRYVRSRSEFACWCNALGVDLSQIGAADLDVLVARFVLHMKEEDDSPLTRQGCLDLLSSLQKRVGQPLRNSLQVLRLWSREDPPQQAEAMPSVIAFAMVTVLHLVVQSPAAAFHTLLAFCGCLRIGESLNLRRCDIVLPRSRHHVQLVVLILRATKRSFDQRVVIAHPTAVQMICDFLALHGPDDVLELAAAMSYGRFARAFKRAVQALQLPGPNWRSHSLRRGSATSLMEAGMRFEEVRLFGRWASETSAREYIRLGQTALARLQHRFSAEQWRRFEVLAGASATVFKA